LRGLRTDLHHTRLAIEALASLGNDRCKIAMTDCILHLWEEISDPIEGRSFDDILDLIGILGFEESGSDKHKEDLHAYLTKLDSDSEELRGISARNLSNLIISSHRAFGNRVQHLQHWANLLIKLKNDDGCWSASMSGSTSLVVTAMAIRSLNSLGKDFQNHVDTGRDYILQVLDEKGWEGIGTGGDVFTKASVLSAMGPTESEFREVIRNGVESLLKQKNTDGGWGGSAGEISNIECTSLSVVALVSCGENRVVPSWVANIAWKSVAELNRSLNFDLTALREEFEKKVEIHCGKIVDELKKMKTANSELTIKTKNLSDELRTISRDIYIRHEDEGGLNRKYQSSLRIKRQGLIRSRFLLFSLIFSAMSYFTISIFLKSFFVESGVVFETLKVALLSLITLILFLYIYGVIKRRAVFDRETIISYSSSRMQREIDRAADLFSRLTLKWPVELREHFIYRLYTERLSEMPTDVARRFAQELLLRFPVPDEQRSEFTLWIRNVAELDMESRKILLDIIRRAWRG
ncbi:MAG TPA: hypothetical protein VHP63_02785, partial [candidate division Zixibacteria bacterium]|nr:hypothetical protein [candidate division Zixibacteria bacterium]